MHIFESGINNIRLLNINIKFDVDIVISYM